jgi:hypothetical protein
MGTLPSHTRVSAVGGPTTTSPARRVPSAGRVAAILCGLVLLAAAVLKLGGLAVGPVAETGRLNNPGAQVLLVQFEIALALWLFSGWRPRVAKWVAVGVFTLFALLSLSAALAGQPSCGCFGKLVVNPWWTFAFDLLVAGVLSALPAPASAAIPIRLWPILWLIGGSSLAAGLLVLTAVFWAGSVPQALGRIRGETVVLPDRIVQAEPGRPGEPRTVLVRVANRAAHPVRVIGGTADCSCLTTQDLPATIPPGETVAVRVTIHPGAKPGEWFRVVKLLTDDDTTPSVVVGVSGEVVE